MLRLIGTYLLKFIVKPNYKDLWADRLKELMMAEATQIAKLLCYILLAFPLLALCVYELINFFSQALYDQANVDYLHLLNAALLAVPVILVTARTIYYAKELKEKITTIGKVITPSPGILSPIFEQLRKEQQTFLIELNSQYQKE